jgi:hypothetical protein
MSSLVSRPEIFCWVLVGRRPRSLMLLVGQIRVSVQNRRTSPSWSRQNSSSARPGGWAVELRGPGLGRTSWSPTWMAWRNSLISGWRTSSAMSVCPVSRAWFQAWISPRSARWGHRQLAQLAEVVWRYGHGWIGRVDLWRCVSGGRGGPSDFVPRGESGGHFTAVLLGTQPVATGPEVWGDAAEGGQEPLRVTG